MTEGNMDNTKLISFKNSTFAQTHPDDFTFWHGLSVGKLNNCSKQFVIFSDFYNFEKYVTLFDSLKRNNNFKGIIVSIDSNLFTLSQRFFHQNISKSVHRKMATVAHLDVMNRYIHAWKIGAQNELLADFKINHKNNFYLMDCNFNFYTGDLMKFDLFYGATPAQVQNFELDKHGSFIYWRDLDLHLDLDYFKSELDGDYKKKLITKSLERNKYFGISMKKFREANDVFQNSFETLSDKQIRRYENGSMYPSYNSLEKIANRFNLNVTDYLTAIRKTSA